VKLHQPLESDGAEASLNSLFCSFFILSAPIQKPWKRDCQFPYRLQCSAQSQHIVLTCFPVSFDIMSNPQYPSRHVRNKLYISHFLSTWNSRLFEFGAVLFISTIFPGTLFPASIYALTRSASVVVFSTAIGHLIDRSERISLIRLSIGKLFSFVDIIFHIPLDLPCCSSLSRICLVNPLFSF
jgi:hypothetical protein